MPRWLRIPSWKRLTSRFRCWMRWRGGKSEERLERMELLDRPDHGVAAEPAPAPKDAFEEVDFGSYFQDYLDPGYRTQPEYEESEKPSFEHFLSQPTSLSDHLAWQLGALTLEPRLHGAAEYVVGNLDEDGYLAADEEELATALRQASAQIAPGAEDLGPEAALALVRSAIDLVQQLDPAGVGARDLRECLLIQIAAQQLEFLHLYGKQADEPEEDPHGSFRAEAEARVEERRRSMEVATLIVDQHLALLQKRDLKDLARAVQITPAEAHAGLEFIRTLDPRPGRQYNREQTRLIEPDVVFVKRGAEWEVAHERRRPAKSAAQFPLQTNAHCGEHRQRGQGLCEGAIPLGDAAYAKHSATEEHHPAHMRGDRPPAEGFSGSRRRSIAAHDD